MSTNEELVLRAEAAAQQVAKDKAEIQALVKKLDDVQAPSIAKSKEDMKNILVSLGADVDDNTPLGDFANKIRKAAVALYKCASVDTTNKTWTGYKVVVPSGSDPYTLEADATEGLTYGTSGNTPEVGGIYDNYCRIVVDSMTIIYPVG